MPPSDLPAGLTYKGYAGRLVSYEKGVFHGEVDGLISVITFRGKNRLRVEKAFRESIDDYLDFCKERKEKPENPYGP